MGLLSKLGGAVKEGIRKGAVNGILKATGNGAATGKVQFAEYEYDANGNIKGVNSQYATQIANNFGSSTNVKDGIDGKSSGLTQGSTRPRYARDTIEMPTKYDKAPHNKLKRNKVTRNTKINQDLYSDVYKLKLPDWTYADFINERAIWQKGLSSIFDEPAWFYFKIFFDFDTNHGLFGGLLNDLDFNTATNSAAKYLYSIRNLHIQEKPIDRINALYKFASILSYINSNAPWYFKSVKGLNKVMNPTLNEYSKEKSIEIDVLPDAVDMRLTSMMSLYNYACYDVFQSKEIIPQNLRKFNMSIIIFQSPLRYLHTSYTTKQSKEFLGINTSQLGLDKFFNKSNGKINYKSMNPNHGESGHFANTMSMQVITLLGCEFDSESMSTVLPGDISNENPFQLGGNTIKITYTSSTVHNMNEFFGFMFGNDGFYFNQYSNFQTEDGIDGYVNKLTNGWATQLNRYNTLAETFDNLATGGTILGIIDSPKSYKAAIDATEAVMNGIGEEKNLLGQLGTNFALGLLGSSSNTNAPQGNIYGDYGIGSAYYKDKLEMLKNGVHERTQAPYYYDPYTGVRVDMHKSKSYTAYNFKNDISSVKNFNVSNWLNDTVSGFGNKLNNSLRGLFDGSSGFTEQPYRPNEYNKQNAQSMDAKRFEGVGKNHNMVDDPNTWDRVQKPYTYNPENAVNNEFNKDVAQASKDMVDIKGNPANQVTEKPFNYDSQNAVSYEENKAGGQYKVTDMVNTFEHKQTIEPFTYDAQGAIEYEKQKVTNESKSEGNTEAPFNYDPQNAVSYEQGKAGGQYKVQDMVDGIGNDEHQVTEKPFNYDPQNAVSYEQGKAGGQYKVQDMVDGIGNGEHEVTEAPFNYDPQNAVSYEQGKAGGQYKVQDMVDGVGNPEHQVTEAPFNYDPQNAVSYEQGKAGGQYKVQDMVDGVGNPEHQVTEAPFNYDPQNAVSYEQGKAGGQYKVQDMVDGIGNPEHQVTEKPFNYDPKNAVNYENSKAGGQYKVQDMVDGIGNAEHEVTEAPFNFDPKEAVNYENSKAGGQYKVQDMVDGIGNAEHEVTEAPFNYDPKEAVNYENSKAGGQYKVQDMVDGIGNAEHEVTEAPFNYDPKEAVNYENSKAGGQYKVQDMVDGIGNPEHVVTEAPFNYDPQSAVSYEQGKAGGQYKAQDMVDGIGNPEHQVTEKPFNYDPQSAVSYEQGKAGGQYKVQDMVDGIGNPEHKVTEKPFNYDPQSAVSYEQGKAGGQYKAQDMVDGIGNPEHTVTEAPFNYDPKNAITYEQNKK